MLNLDAVELHLFCREQPAHFDYFLDDRETRHYADGAHGVAHCTAEIEDGCLRVVIRESGHNYPSDTVTFTPVIYGHPELRELEYSVNGRTEVRALHAEQREWLCRTLDVQV